MLQFIYRVLLIGLCCFAVQQGVAQKLDCQTFRNGVFRIADPESGTTTIITRKGNKQREVQGTEDLLLKVKWIDECTYTLTLLKENGMAPSHNKIKGYDPKLVITVQIYDTHENYYMQRSSTPDHGVVFTSKVSRVK